MTLSLVQDTINRGKQSRALAPNFIHSLDAACLSLLDCQLFKDKNFKGDFFSINDCYATNISNVQLLMFV